MKDIAKYVLAEAVKSNIEKRKVGAVIVLNDKILAKGFNTELLHAEIAALANLEGSAEGAIMYVSQPPCPNCAEEVLAKGIESIEVIEEFIKFDGDKNRMDLIPASTLEALGAVLTFGARKYKPNNWKLCKDIGQYEAAMLRHYAAYKSGEEFDSESGMPHTWHMLCNIAFIVELT